MSPIKLPPALDLHQPAVRLALAHYLAVALRQDGRGIRSSLPTEALIEDALTGFSIGLGMAEAESD